MARLHELGKDHPIEDAVRTGLVGKDFYEQSPEACRYLLWNYEEHLAKSLGSAATVDEHERRQIWKVRASDSVEHVFPQNPGTGNGWDDRMRGEDGVAKPIREHVGRIGNLLLLPAPLNSEAKALPFDAKKAIYAKHNLRMVQEVCSESDWSLTEIERREASIVDWAKVRWADIQRSG